MSAHTVITCDTVGQGMRCRGTTTVYHTCIVSFARELAARDGWSTRAEGRTGEIQDLCPNCAPRKAPATRLIPGGVCPTSAPCHVLGHDALGHRLTNILARAGMSLEEAFALTNADLFKLPGLGPAGIARLKSRLSEMRSRRR